MKTFIKCLILLLFFHSCKKDDERKPVLAGVYDKDFLFYQFSPVLPLDLKPDTVNKFSYGSDSLDINHDGIYDMIFTKRILPLDMPPAQNSADNYPFGGITLKDEIELSTRKEFHPIGHGQTSQVNWVDTLLYNSRIDNLPEWSGANTFRLMWVVPPGLYLGSNGCWYDLVNAERYIGIRMKINERYHYGWIRVKQVSREEVYIVSYALEK